MSNKLSLSDIEYAVDWFARKLLGDKLAEALDIEIIQYWKGSDGYCMAADDRKKHREFELGIRKGMGRNRTLRAIAHEMVHVKQYAHGELDCNVFMSSSGSSVRYKNKMYTVTGDYENYLNLPWEIEAFGREEGLVHLFEHHLKTKEL